jgi:rRNA maturation protein Nop10
LYKPADQKTSNSKSETKFIKPVRFHPHQKYIYLKKKKKKGVCSKLFSDIPFGIAVDEDGEDGKIF